MTDPELYRNYNDWKGWGGDDFMRPSPSDLAYFDAELAGAPVRSERFLDIGFGNGWVLSWARQAGASAVYGTELDDETVARAMAAGVEVLPAAFGDWPDELAGTFGTITAFDVLEHLDLAEVRVLLDRVARLLRPGGRFIARFPNGQSPFGGVNQAGDVTHVTFLSGPIIEQLAIPLPFRTVRIANMRMGPYGGGTKRVVATARAVGDRLLSLVARTLYSIRAPLGPNVIVVLERTEG